jgi:hypothetical protein
MQQGLRPISLQDENRVGVQSFGGNTGPVKETPLPSARKAFGLQNRGNNNATEIGHPAKTPAPGTVSRIALGDITNASTKKQQQNASAATAGKLGIFADVSCGVGPDQQQQDQQQSVRLDDLAKDDPERTLGKSWKELEADRISKEDDDIADRLSGLGQANASRTRFPSFFPWQAATASSLAYTSTQQYEAVSSPPSSPLVQNSSGRDLGFEKNVDDMLDLSSIELPDL